MRKNYAHKVDNIKTDLKGIMSENVNQISLAHDMVYW
jgi:hypothetical protein